MLKVIAVIFGIIMLAVGVLGFVPQALDGDLLFGIFRVNPIHNWIHILTGAVALLCGLNSEYASRVFFQIFGIVYGLVTLLGFYYQDEDIFGLIAHNMADMWLHLAISLLSLFLGFVYKDTYLPTDRNDRTRNL